MINVNNQRGTDSYYVGSAIFHKRLLSGAELFALKLISSLMGFDLPLILFFLKYKKFIEVSMRVLKVSKL